MPRTSPADAPIVVLLVDDQRFIGMAVSRLLSGEGDMQLHCCYSAAAAIDQANKVAPTVILQDLVMPDVDGLTLVGSFRSNPRTAATPIIVLSGNDDASSRAKAMAAGADDYLVKLPDRQKLVACIRRHASGALAAGTAGAPPATAQADVSFDRALIGALRAAGGAHGAELATLLVRHFLAEASSLVAAITEAVQREDTAALKIASCSLRGTAVAIGARRLGALSGQIEDYTARHPDVGVDAALLSTMAEELGRVRVECLLETPGA